MRTAKSEPIESRNGLTPQGNLMSTARPESVRPESVRPESVRPESVRPEGVRPENLPAEPAHHHIVRRTIEACRLAKEAAAAAAEGIATGSNSLLSSLRQRELEL